MVHKKRKLKRKRKRKREKGMREKKTIEKKLVRKIARSTNCENRSRTNEKESFQQF